MTGVLIGGQKQVVWDFKPTTAAGAIKYTIYDNILKSQPGVTLTATTSASATNYTLALETPVDETIYVAVELVNNGKDFEGKDGVVPSGCKFYLVAELAPSAGAGYDATTMNQVFKQDYKTIANFVIPTGYAKGETGFPDGGNIKGLGTAYNVVPDLRTPLMELGLSVDLTWASGLVYDNVEIGN